MLIYSITRIKMWHPTTLITLFAVVFALHLYVRSKVLKSYHRLSRSGVEISLRSTLTHNGLDTIVQKYPSHREELMRFAKHIRISLGITAAVVIIAFTLVVVQNF